MIESIAVENYKNLGKLELSGLSRIVLIGGENNCGKSSLLEAIHLLCNPTSEKEIFSALFRNITPQTSSHPWPLIFSGYKTDKIIKVSSLPLNNWLHISTSTNPDYPPIIDSPYYVPALENRVIFHANISDSLYTYYVTYNGTPALSIYPKENQINTLILKTGTSFDHHFISNLYTKMVLDKEDSKDIIIDQLKRFDSNISNIELLSPGPVPTLHFVMKSGFRVSTLMMGEGIQRLTLLLFNLIQLKNGILLIDEVENGLHHSGHVQFWTGLSKLARQLNCQIIATTHSYECIQAAYNGCLEHPEDLTFVRLDKMESGEVLPAVFTHDMMRTCLRQRWEIR